MRGLSGHVALITGAAAGIGRAIALRLGEEGCLLALVDRDGPSLQELVASIGRTGGQALAIQADVTATDEVCQALAMAQSRYGRLDILVNNAGGSGLRVPARDLTDEAWDQAIELNLGAAFRCARQALPALLVRGGAIVNISSVNSVLHAPGLPAYSAAKAGLDGLTRQLALEYGHYGVRVNAVNPGLIATPPIQAGFDADCEDARLATASYPLDRLGRPEEVAAAVAFLASDEASFITGVTLLIDGGLSIQSAAAVMRNTLRAGWRSGQIVLHDA
ncbi:SDR family oxidoreductase [Candidatus Gracilibacteria bacterium]|nr:SDR family oxidoreductase [Candidatus Gracilibacteria bacterium]